MNKSYGFVVFFVASVLLATGCAMPLGTTKSSRDLGITDTSSVTLGSQKSATQFIAPPAVPVSAPLVGSDPTPLAQVGYTSASGACGCQACAGSSCHNGQAPAPQGYLMQTPVGWNAYGIDPQEFICDGGDRAPDAIVRRDDSFGGVELEDTVVRYTTDAGDIHVQASNRACLYAPRFGSVRKITGALAGGRAIGLAQMDRPVGTVGIDSELPGLVMTDSTELARTEVARHLDAMRERTRGVPVENVWQLELAGNVLEAMAGLSIHEVQRLQDDQKAVYQRLALAAVTWDLDESLEVAVQDQRAPTLTRDEHLQGFTIYEFPGAGRLRISKLADRGDALPGETVQFVIRVENVGDSSVRDVTLVDNLTTRLEYVDGSQESSIETAFTATPNNGQSSKLQWTIGQPLAVGQSVTIKFQCRVR